MKRSHHSLRRWVTTVALTAALLDSQSSVLAADSSNAENNTETSPTETSSITAAESPNESPVGSPAESPSASVTTPVPVTQAAPATPSPAAPSRPAETIRLEAARQRVEAHLAAIVARDQAAKAALLQQNLVAAALRYAEAGDFEQARRTAEHPALPAAMQAETLTQIAAIALLHQGATIAAAIDPTAETIATATPAATAPTGAVRPTSSALPPVSASATSFGRSPFRLRVGDRCLPPQASFLSVTAPSPLATEAAIAARPIKTIGTLTSLKSSIRKAAIPGEVAVPESIELRSRNQADSSEAIEVKLAGVAAAIPDLVTSPVTAFSVLKSPPLSGLVKAIVQASPLTASAALPSLPVVYVDAKVNRPPAAQPAVATDCADSRFAAVRNSTRSSMQRLAQFGMAFPLPIPAAITSAFGWRIHPISGDRRFHAGVDFGAPMGTPVLAALPGEVVAAGSQGGYGLTVILENQGHRNLYAHLSAIAVQPGQVVSAGSIIGWVGSTGNSTGPHLHFESQYLTAQGWQAVDPLVNGTLARGR